MRRLGLFLGIVLAVLAAAVVVNWRIDPENDYYDSGMVSAALAGGPGGPCLISNDLLEPNAWLPFKLDLVRRRRATTVVLGSSRVGTMVAPPHDTRFVNAGIPGTGVESLLPLMRRIRPLAARRLTIYLGFDFFWLNPDYSPALTFGVPLRTQLAYLLSRQTLRTSLSMARSRPGAIVRRWTTSTFKRTCAVERRPGDLETGTLEAWRVDGSMIYRWELVPQGPRRPEDLPIPNLSTQYFNKGYTGMDGARLRLVAQALAYARAQGWKVVAYSPPYAPRYRNALLSYPLLRRAWHDFAGAIEPVFRAAGYPFLDLREVSAAHCTKEQFVDEGWHPNRACSTRIRALLAAAAARERYPTPSG